MPREITERRFSDDTYAELVRSLFATLAPTAIMSILFIITAWFANQRHEDAALDLLGVLGGAASLVRVAVTLGYERRLGAEGVGTATVAKAERLFRITYLSFAALLGLFAARALQIGAPDVAMVVVTLVVGYAAGVAAGVSLRPRIAIPATLLAVVPSGLTAASGGDLAHGLLALILVALLTGGIGSMVGRYRSEVNKIQMRHTFASLARTDHLTGLANRLALEDAFTAIAAQRGTRRLALHLLDLDRFKPVNDEFGHPAGDRLLLDLANRLQATARGHDIVARLGGDEFALLQTNVDHEDEARLMALRVVRAISGTYDVGDRRVAIGVSLGYAMPESCGHDLGSLLRCADSALYRVKRAGGGAAAHASSRIDAIAAAG